MSQLNQFPLFDAHMHIIPEGYPLVENQGFTPEHFEISDYQQRMKEYNCVGGVVVSGSFQGYDQTYLVDTLEKLGSNYVGVAQLPVDVTDDEILALNEKGVRGIRFNLKRGDNVDPMHMVFLGQQVAALCGWHSEFYVDSTGLAALLPVLSNIRHFSIDHMGLSQDGMFNLLKAIEVGAWVKASGFSRGDLDVDQALKSIYTANPECLMFGTDLPSTRAPVAYQDADYLKVIEVLGEDAAKRVFADNAEIFYRIKESECKSVLKSRPG